MRLSWARSWSARLCLLWSLGAPLVAHAASESAETAVELRGRVTNWEGDRIPATVRAYATETLFEQFSREIDGRSPEPLARATPDSRGLFVMRFRTSTEFVRLEVRPEGDRWREILLPVRHTRIDAPALRLDGSATAQAPKRSSIRVLDRDRLPLSNAAVFETSLHYLFARGVAAWRGGPRRFATDADGAMQLDRVRNRALGGSSIQHGAVAVTLLDASRSAPKVLRSNVVDGDGRPVPGAVVLWNLGAPACGRTDENGRLEIDDVPATRLIALTADGRWGQTEVPARPPELLVIQVDQQETAEDLAPAHLVGPRLSVDSMGLLPLARSYPTLFSVVTAFEGEETRGVSLARLLDVRQAVSLESGDPTWSLDATVVTKDAEGKKRRVQRAVGYTQRGWSYSGDDGTLRFDNLNGVTKLRVQAPGFAATQVDVTPQSGSLEIELRPGGTGFGQVTDLQGQPVEEALVALQMTEGPGSSDLTTSTEASGGFEFHRLPRGVFQLRVEARGFAPATLRGIETIDDGRFEIGTVALQPGAELHGVVLDERGDPLSGVSVRFATSPGLRRLDASFTTYTRRSGGRPLAFHDANLETDDEGRFVLPELLPNESFQLGLTKRGYLPLDVPIELPVEDEVELRLEASAVLLGTVSHRDGDPVEGATIELQKEDTPDTAPPRRWHRRATTNPEGHYEFPSVPTGKYRLTARAQGLAVDVPEQPIPLSAGTTKQIDLTVGPGATVEGTIFHSNREPASSVTVSLGGQTDATARDGSYRLDGVRTGQQTFRASTRLGSSTVFDVEVLPGANVVDAEVGGFRLTGQVLHADGRPAVGAFVSGRGASAVADVNGEFVLEGAERGKLTVWARLDDQRANLEIDVPEQAENIILTLRDREARGSIRGSILGLDTDELAQVELLAAGPAWHRGPRPDFEGNFLFHNLRPGEWSVRARLASGNRQKSQPVTVEEGETAEVVLDFELGSASLEVVVLRDGRPTANVGLGLESLAGEDPPVVATYGRSDYSGVARFDRLESGSYRLTPTEPGGGRYLWREIEILGDESLTIDLRPTTLRGSITGPAGTRVALRLVHDTGQTFERKIVLPASYTFVVETGSYRLEVAAPGVEPQSLPVQLSGESTRLDFSLGDAQPP